MSHRTSAKVAFLCEPRGRIPTGRTGKLGGLLSLLPVWLQP